MGRNILKGGEVSLFFTKCLKKVESFFEGGKPEIFVFYNPFRLEYLKVSVFKWVVLSSSKGFNVFLLL